MFAVKTFDKQIDSELKRFESEHHCPSYWSKKVFLASQQLNIEDWAEIRSNNYYQAHDSICRLIHRAEKENNAALFAQANIQLNKFIFERITQYKKRL